MTKGTIVRPASQAIDLEQEPNLRELLTMLTYRRPSGSKTERKFRNRWLMPLGCEVDDFGNLWLTINKTDGSEAPILFCSHTDTVHKEGGRGRVSYGDGVAMAEGSNCLGADDTVGVWLMMNMIRAKVPGTYLFHFGEEHGGIGSRALAKERPDMLQGFKYAIAFDRKGYDHVITHQFEGRTASDEFAHSMSMILKPLPYHPCDGGTFTDTASYADIIPECTNLSVGYFDQHTAKEWQDCEFALKLLDVLIDADWDKLVCCRTPGDYGYSEDNYWNKGSTWPSRNQPSLLQYVKRNPETVADFLELCGYDVNDLEEFVWESAVPINYTRSGTTSLTKPPGNVIDLTKSPETAVDRILREQGAKQIKAQIEPSEDDDPLDDDVVSAHFETTED